MNSSPSLGENVNPQRDKQGPCRGCGQDRKLIQAHIIPRAFFPLDDPSGHPSKILSDSPTAFPKKSPIGPYDKRILCLECEGRFEEGDDYAAKLLIHGEHKILPLRKDENTVGYQVESFDYRKLKLFAIGVLWRAAVSSHEYYNRVQLGPYEQAAKAAVWSGSPPKVNEFACVFSRFDSRIMGEIMLNPHRERLYGVNFYRIYLGRYILQIKVDSRPLGNPMAALQIRPEAPLLLIRRSSNAPPELKPIMNIVSTLQGRGHLAK